MPVDRFEQLFLLARSGGAKRPSDWAELAWSTLSCQGLKLLKDGQTLESEAQNLAELKAKSELFNQQQLPILLALGATKSDRQRFGRITPSTAVFSVCW